MKRMLKQIIIFLIILLVPVTTKAEVIESDLCDVYNSFNAFKAGKITMFDASYNRYNKETSSKGENISISVTIRNNYDTKVQLDAYLNLYDENKKLINKYTETKNIIKSGEVIYKVRLYESELDINIDDIKYYSFGVELLSDLSIVEEAVSDSYYMEDYKLNVKVNENNVYHVEQSFNAIFKKNVSSLNIGIPFRLKYERANGEKVNKRAIISNIVTDDKYTLDTVEGIRTVTVGERDISKTEKVFSLNYDYNVGKDTLKNNDEFIFYFVNNNKVQMDGIKFEIEMPKKFEQSSVKFIDQNGNELNNVLYVVSDNKIMGNIMEVINPGTSYAVYVLLEDGYFSNTSSNISLFTILSFGISVIAVIIVLVRWLFLRKSKNRVKYNSLYFNEKINSLEMGYLYNGYIKDNDIATLIFCLANKGYIIIEKNKKNYKIIKKCNYDGDDRVERAFMQELFTFKDEITKKELLYSLKEMRDVIDVKLTNTNRKKKIFEHKILNDKLFYWLLISLIIIFNTVNILIEYQPSVIPVNIIFPLIGYIVLINGIFGKNKNIEKVIYSLVALIFIITPIVLSSYKAFLQDYLYLVIYVLGVMSMLLIAGIIKGFGSRTRYGSEILNKITAYKEYIINCNELWLDKAMKNNKNCFCDVLPYTFVLGISDKWYQKFKDKDVSKPDWYKTEKFNLDDFYSDVKNIYSDIFVALKNSGSNE